MNLVFLHIPKTAGQSVHHFLLKHFDKNVIFPARVNSQIGKYTIEEVKRYQVFSGHFDMSFLELVDQPKFAFTILREPIDRILSYYFYLRSEAQKLTDEERDLPERRGMKIILELSPDEYFCSTSIPERTFIDNHYDNFYMYYFGMKSYQGRAFANQQIDMKLLTIDDVYDKAIDRMNELNAVYSIENWNQLSYDLKSYFPEKQFVLENIHVNKGDGNSREKRLKQLVLLGATDKTLTRIEEFCQYDNKLYNQFCQNV